MPAESGDRPGTGDAIPLQGDPASARLVSEKDALPGRPSGHRREEGDLPPTVHRGHDRERLHAEAIECAATRRPLARHDHRAERARLGAGGRGRQRHEADEDQEQTHCA